MTRTKKIAALVSATTVAAVGSAVLLAGSADANDVTFRAKLKDPSGRTVGTVVFEVGRDSMHVDARMRPNRYVATNAFHGFHVHKSATAAVTPCEADPKADSTTWFVSAGGHLAESGQMHGMHEGDMPSPLVLSDGTAELSFTTDRIDPRDLKGTAVILHAKPDNFGNVPVGTAANQYTANGAAATDATSKTGNAGDRVACGQVTRARWHW